MVYINSDGTIGTRPVWHRQIVLFFWGFINFITAFFCTLVNPALNGKGSRYQTNYQDPWRPGGGGGGGGGPPRGPPNRRIGRIATIQSCQAPMPGGG